MHFSFPAFVLTTLATLASAQNPFTFTTLTSITAGTPFNITWAPSTGTVDTVTLLLRQGDPSALTTVATIASSIQNTGSYVWTPPTSLVAGSGYAFEIIDDGNTFITNYSNQFSIVSTNTVSSSLPSTSTSAGTVTTSGTTSGLTTRASTTSGSSTGTKTGSTTATSAGTTTSGTAAASTTGKSGAGGLKVGVGLLGAVGAVMALL